MECNVDEDMILKYSRIINENDLHSLWLFEKFDPTTNAITVTRSLKISQKSVIQVQQILS